MDSASRPHREPPDRKVVALQTRDFDELAGAFQRWRQQFQQLSGGPFLGSLLLGQAGGLQLLRVSTNRAIQARGTQPQGSYVFCPALPSNLDTLCRGRPLRPGRVVVLAPGEEMDHRTHVEYASVILSVEATLLARVAASLGAADPEEALAGRVTVQARPADCEAFAADLGRLLGELNDRPDLAARPGAWRAAEEECVRRLLHTLGLAPPLSGHGHGHGHAPSHSARLAPGRRAVVRRAEEYMLAFLQEPVTVADLCDRTGVSERTLHYAFLDVLGMTPKAYMKARRLNRVRQDLKAADPAADSVAAIAARWGFHHLGNFAADYRRLFGELPSRTLCPR